MLRPLPLPRTRVGEVVFVGVITNDLRLRGPPALRGQEVRLKGLHFSLEKCRRQIRTDSLFLSLPLSLSLSLAFPLSPPPTLPLSLSFARCVFA